MSDRHNDTTGQLPDVQGAHSWADFHERFMQLAREEQGREDVYTKGKVLRSMDQLVGAFGSYRKRLEGWEIGKPEQGQLCLLETPPHGAWRISDGVSENFHERVRVCVTEAGRALPAYPNGAVAEDFWLHQLYLDLRKNHSELLRTVSEEEGMIISVCVASATFCSRLQRQALGEMELDAAPSLTHNPPQQVGRGWGISHAASELGEEVKKSEEWLRLVEAIAEAQLHHGTETGSAKTSSDQAPEFPFDRVIRSPLDSAPDIAKRRAIIKQNRQVEASGICSLWDGARIPLTKKMQEAGSWVKAYRSPKYRHTVEALISRDRKIVFG